MSPGAVPFVLRALPRGRLAAGACVAFGVAGLLSSELGGDDAVAALKYAALALGLAVATILDDPAATTVAAAPRTLLRRRGLTLAVAAPALAAAWIAVVSVAAVDAAVAFAMTLELAAVVLVALALAVGLEGAVAGPLVVLAFLGIDAFAPDWAVAPDLADWRFVVAWAGSAALGLAALLRASRDPAGARPAMRS